MVLLYYYTFVIYSETTAHGVTYKDHGYRHRARLALNLHMWNVRALWCADSAAV